MAGPAFDEDGAPGNAPLTTASTIGTTRRLGSFRRIGASMRSSQSHGSRSSGNYGAGEDGTGNYGNHPNYGVASNYGVQVATGRALARRPERPPSPDVIELEDVAKNGRRARKGKGAERRRRSTAGSDAKMKDYIAAKAGANSAAGAAPNVGGAYDFTPILAELPRFGFHEDTDYGPLGTLHSRQGARKPNELRRSHLTMGAEIGQGQFGAVVEGVFAALRGQKIPCAIKVLKGNANGEVPLEGHKDMVREAAITAQFRHDNVVSLIGVVTIGDPIMLVLYNDFDILLPPAPFR